MMTTFPSMWEVEENLGGCCGGQASFKQGPPIHPTRRVPPGGTQKSGHLKAFPKKNYLLGSGPRPIHPPTHITPSHGGGGVF